MPPLLAEVNRGITPEWTKMVKSEIKLLWSLTLYINFK
jgi:hypothetical protein